MVLKIKVPELFYILSYSIYLVGKIISISTIPSVLLSVNLFLDNYYYLSVLFLLLKLIADRTISANNIIKSALLLSLIILSIFFSQNVKYLSYFFLLIFSSANVDLKKVVKYFCIVLGITQVLIWLGYFSGVLPNYYAISSGVYRYSLGYKYITYASNLFFHFTLAYLYVRGQKVKFLELLLLSLIGLYFYQQTGTDSAFLLGLLATVAVFIVKLFKIPTHFENLLTKFIERWLLLISALSAIFLTLLYDSSLSLASSLDQLLNNRLRLGYEAIRTYGINLFGHNIEEVGTSISGNIIRYDTDYNFVDSSFIKILLTYGLAMLLFLIIAYFILSYNNPYRTLTYSICFSVLVLHSIWDPQFFDIFYNPFLIFIAVLFSQTIQDKEYALHSRI